MPTRERPTCWPRAPAQFPHHNVGHYRSVLGFHSVGGTCSSTRKCSFRMPLFGRTARINGSEGTDHGTGTVAILVGGALKGGRVIADWPGLKDDNLYERRDLRPTIDLRAVLKGVLKDHLRVEERALAATVFPGSDDVKPMEGLV